LPPLSADALTESHGFRLPDKAATWWIWHNGARTAELIPHQRMASLDRARDARQREQGEGEGEGEGDEQAGDPRGRHDLPAS
jgi:hypothetical protein